VIEMSLIIHIRYMRRTFPNESIYDPIELFVPLLR